MKKTLKNLTALVLAICVMLTLASCDFKDPKEVSIKVRCNQDGEEWIFTPDIDEINITRRYDGEKHELRVIAWQLPYSHQASMRENWIRPRQEGANQFEYDILYTAPDGTYNVQSYYQERGEYSFTCSTVNAVIMNPRSIILNIKVV